MSNNQNNDACRSLNSSLNWSIQADFKMIASLFGAVGWPVLDPTKPGEPFSAPSIYHIISDPLPVTIADVVKLARLSDHTDA